MRKIARDIPDTLGDHVDSRVQLSVHLASHRYSISVVEGTERDMLYHQRYSDMWNSREGHGRPYLRRGTSFVAVEISMGQLKVATEVCGILPARDLAPWSVMGE